MSEESAGKYRRNDGGRSGGTSRPSKRGGGRNGRGRRGSRGGRGGRGGRQSKDLETDNEGRGHRPTKTRDSSVPDGGGREQREPSRNSNRDRGNNGARGRRRGRGRGRSRGRQGGRDGNRRHSYESKGKKKQVVETTDAIVENSEIQLVSSYIDQNDIIDQQVEDSTDYTSFNEFTMANNQDESDLPIQNQDSKPEPDRIAPVTLQASPLRLALPSPPVGVSSTCGVPIILSRRTHPVALMEDPNSADDDREGEHIAEKLAAAALEEDDDLIQEYDCNNATEDVLISSTSVEVKKENDAKSSGPKIDSKTQRNLSKHSGPASKPPGNKKKKRSKAKKETPAGAVEVDVENAVISTTDAIRALPAQEVNITANSLVKVKRSESGASLTKLSETPAVVEKQHSKKKKSALTSSNVVNQRAARDFNQAVRSCVERSDPNAMRELLRDRRNHSFALDKQVLETVMKAYVMAAMFEDALYCLQNCTLPGTLSTQQTERILACLPQNLRNSSAYTAADMINALCIATEFDLPSRRTYFLRIVRGIALEFLEEATSARDRICSVPCERLVRSAQCVVDARLRRGKKPSDLVVNPGSQLGVFVPDTMENRGIQAGDAVSILPYAGPYPMSAESLDRNMIEATVTNAQPLVLRLQDRTNANLYQLLTEDIEGNVYRVDKLANRMGFNRQLGAAVSIASPLEDSRGGKRDTRRASPELIEAITAMSENIDRVSLSGGNFRSHHGSQQTSTAALCAQAVPWSANDESDEVDQESLREAAALALDKYGALEGLNTSQRLAVKGAATNRLTLVQGPPGTGKTAVAIRILQHWARLAGSDDSPNPILATSDSNIAVDNLVEGCAKVGLRVVRLGRPEAIRPELLQYCIDRPQSSYGSHSNQSGYGGGGTPAAFKEKMKILKTAQVICCTCIGSGGDILDNTTFERVLVDEATQATEPAVLVPISRGCRQLVLVGDHCQLPPTVLSTRAEEEGLGVPLFSRMVACGVPPFMLDTQYRMHPAIAMFPSDLFYGGKLLNGVSPPERRPLAGFPWPREEFPVAFVPVLHGSEMDDGVSKLNEAEAVAACDAVGALLGGGQCSVSDIAVVTPYSAQVRLIRRMTRKFPQGRVEVSSTDGFQGREKEAVIFSAVRSNDSGAVGFVSDWRRVNVSFTRARRALIVIGNDQTLRRGDPETWLPWLAWADAHGINMDKPGIPRGRYEPEQLRRVRGDTTAAEMVKDVLARQQAQLKVAERQLERAEKNSAGHIMGNSRGDDEDAQGSKEAVVHHSLKEEIALLSNTDGNWDDSDDENETGASNKENPASSALQSVDHGNEGLVQDMDAPLDAWDL